MDVPAIGSPPVAGEQAVLEGFEAAYREHFSFVWRNLVRLGVAPNEAEDAVQEVFVIAYRRWQAFEYRASVRTWLFAISRRVAAHHRRSTRRRWRRHEAFRRVADSTHDGERAVAGRHAAVRLQSFLERLEPQKREVFVLADLEGFTGREIARSLGINANTAWSRLRAARAEFKRAFGRRPPRPCSGVVVDDHGAPVGARARVWALLVPKLSAGSVTVTAAKGVGLVSLAQTWVLGENLKFFLGTLVLGGALLGGASKAVERHDPTQRTAATIPAAIAAQPQRPVEVEVQRATQPAVPAAAAEPEPSVQTPVPVQRPKTMARSKKKAPSKTIEPEPAAHPSPSEPVESALLPVEARSGHPSDPAGRELQILHRAKGALEAGDATKALSLLDQHARRFPDGVLADVAASVRVDTLCALGRIGEARVEVSRATDRVAQAKLRQRFTRACRPDAVASIAPPR